MAKVVRRQHRIAPEDIVLEDARKGPRHSAAIGKGPAGLAEIRTHAIELSPADRHFIAICEIDRDRWLVRGVARDVLAVATDVYLVTGERTVLRNSPLRYIRSPDKHRRILVALNECLGRKRIVRSCLAENNCDREGDQQTSEQPDLPHCTAR